MLEEVVEVGFQVLLVVEPFLSQIVRERPKQMVVSRSQVWRIRWMGNGNPSKVQQLFAGRLGNVWSGVVMQKVGSILLSFQFLCNSVQLLTVTISSDGTTIRKKFPMNNTFDSPPNAQHDLLRMEVRLWYCCAYLTNTESLATA
jgi:hypothetical protein